MRHLTDDAVLRPGTLEVAEIPVLTEMVVGVEVEELFGARHEDLWMPVQGVVDPGTARFVGPDEEEVWLLPACRFHCYHYSS